MNLFSAGFARAALVTALVAFAEVASAADVPSPAPSAAPSAAAATGASVDTKNYAYAPATLTVHPGVAVVFKNSDSVAHTVTAADKSFDSGDMAPGATWSHIFTKAGTYAYVCAYHSYMQGTILVK